MEIALALDTSPENAYVWVERAAEFVDVFKIPPWNFYTHGAPLIQAVKKHGRKLFADLKLHDIPNTVSRTVEALAKQGVG
ncbi:MAG: orotidine 5'-phosphate decarboxylase / HUMPS family protein, partial [Methylocella sp.]